METKMKKYRQVSPERAKVWTEKSPKYQQKIKKVPVVYYLCRNRQLEHPHFMEVTLSSQDGLYLRDVIERLGVLRGRGMASMYSWSCRRSYRNGFVWHDLSQDDLILPARGNEYVLKGSELFDDSNSDRFSPVVSPGAQNVKQIPEPQSSRSLDDSSSSSSMNGKGNKDSQEDELSPPALRSGSPVISPDYRNEKNSSSGGSLCLTEYKVYKSEGLADASTQTDENMGTSKTIETCSRGVSTDDQSLETESKENLQNQASCLKEGAEICRTSVSPASSYSAFCIGGKIKTLESLIRADASKMNNFKIIAQEDVRVPANARLRATNMLMQLISCGSISVKDNSFGIVPTYKPKLGQGKFPSPFFSTSFMLGELDCLSQNPRLMGLRTEDRECFSGSLVETKLIKDASDANTSRKRSTSCNSDRSSNQQDSADCKDDSNPGSEPLRSPDSDKPRDSSDGINSPHNNIPSARENNEKITQIEESLHPELEL